MNPILRTAAAGLFQNHACAEAALQQLRRTGFPMNRVSLITQHKSQADRSEDPRQLVKATNLARRTNMEQRRFGSTQRAVAVIGQGTWYIDTLKSGQRESNSHQ